ncbi:SGNH/GDSL hydrolase family protein [Methylobacterium sp. Leaf118]|uniref:SGNH/GDSL hydrolase family protein n=1 Tax=Methylobacterium sp. Leaf118 TaxID=2876562 RepID=UPI001E322AD1|nr:SGNH/GDSL hydrolase family protein [Methylobacterium sp. Leaf118]
MPPTDRRRFGLVLLAAGLAGRARAEAPRPIVAWGDSLTFGTGARTEAGRYPAALGRAFAPPRPVRNAGVGGESSTQIAARMLADAASRDAVAVIWAGRNNYDDAARVQADIRAMVASLRSGCALVLSILNADVPEEYRGAPGHRAILALNAALLAEHGRRFLDIRGHLVARGLAAAGLTPSLLDRADIARDVPPRALRADHIHLNQAGQAAVAAAVHGALLARSW